jgi:FkbM family methyltransferase
MVSSSEKMIANRAAEHRLAETLGLVNSSSAGAEAFEQHLSSVFSPRDLSVVLTPNEINNAHGTGILAYRLMRELAHVAVLRSHTHYDNTCLLDGPDVVLPATLTSRADVYRFASRAFKPGQLKQIVCIPWHPKELHLAIAIKNIHQCPFVLYIMDDNCLFTKNGISKSLMVEAMEAADIIFAISPEMQIEYQNAFRHKIWILPPLLESSLLLPEGYTPAEPNNRRHGVVVGNIWHQASLDLFCDALGGSGITVDWYCNTVSPGWLSLDKSRLSEIGITFREALPEAQLVEVLREASFAILPSSPLTDNDPTQNIGRLSLPSRVPFIASSSAAPIIVLGSEKTSAGAFVKHFEVGVVADYTSSALVAAVEKVSAPEFRRHVAKQAATIGSAFSAKGMGEWITAAAANGALTDTRFEDMLDYRRKTDFGHYVPPDAPKDIWIDFHPDYEGLLRLKERGFAPSFVLDVGASTGVWSANIARLFPDASYVLVDPLFDQYPKASLEFFCSLLKNSARVKAAVSDHVGSMELEVSENLYGSSLLTAGAGRAAVVTVPVTTLAAIAEEHNLRGGGLVKIDVQLAEHLVIAGGIDFLTNEVDCIVIELTIPRLHPEMKTMLEILNMLDELGFEWADQAGNWRSLQDGRLEQIDVILTRKGSIP